MECYGKNSLGYEPESPKKSAGAATRVKIFFGSEKVPSIVMIDLDPRALPG
jgi:hypothetical protein